MTHDTTQQKDAIRQFLQELGIAYQAEFISMQQPKEKHPQLHWRITLQRGVYGMQCEYRQGVAHVENYKQHHATSYDQRLAEQCYRLTCETGKLYRANASIGSVVIGIQKPPDVIDVVHSLVLDADVLNTVGFEDWAQNYGYDTDSRKAEKIWQQCLAQTRDLLPVIGGYQNLDRLRELYQDY